MLEFTTALGLHPGKYVGIYYIFWWFKSISKILIQNGTGATVHGVKLPFIKALEIPVPPIEEQNKIVDEINNVSEQIKRLEVTYKQKLVLLEELRKSILNEAFLGKL